TGLCTLLTLSNGIRVLTAQPCSHCISGLLLIEFQKPVGGLFPNTVDSFPFSFVRNVSDQKTFEHVERSKREAAIVHSLENGVCIIVGVGRDLHKVDIIE